MNPETLLASLPGYAIAPESIQVLPDAKAYRACLLERIGMATRRIVIVALYLQEDEAGQEVLDALYKAKAARPGLQITVVVDWFRARRGLLGAGRQPGNAAWYQAQRQLHGLEIAIHGVPVQTRELFGVLHLKGSIIDDCVIYTGASLNNVYLHRFDRYRLDRYHLFQSPALADAMADLVQRLLHPAATPRLDLPAPPSTRSLRGDIRRLRARLRRMAYQAPAPEPEQGLRVIPLLGVGRGNRLNRAVCALLAAAQAQIIISTPYFNPPRVVMRELDQALARGVRVELIVGDRTANDFYIPPGEPFSASGALPYLYEDTLRAFVRRRQAAIASGQLQVRIWNDPGHTFHAKGVWVDQRYSLLTGNNLNPRGFNLDLENGLLIDDPHGQWLAPREAELDGLRHFAPPIDSLEALGVKAEHPKEVRRFLRRLRYSRLEPLIKRVL
ncbi:MULTISPECIES: CDP-diacylglycerol--serine O-phosphatidyltransferase [Pseudomonas]|uniref:CDP-diacylglycerol--serine O-phosphatidyltransferase n=1 Tax=Pseudomonas TaxID=286 RepID=UPI000DF9FED0|nr:MULTISPECIES: CDP-diacylglycerol--serine O-phosphatidyltransferase [Pseudomonas]RRV60861.1 CDP-diacylglycerol--serine O-phosphatidyltransferase [Pseudomonas sp. p99-361]SUD78731.1 phosphatidylserine synthase [Pseudomonas putida]